MAESAMVADDTVAPVDVIVHAPFEICRQTAALAVAGEEIPAQPLTPATCSNRLQRETDSIIKKRRSEHRHVYLESTEPVSGGGLDETADFEMHDTSVNDQASALADDDPAVRHFRGDSLHALEPIVSIADHVASDDGAYAGPLTTHFNYFYDITDGTFKLLDDSQFDAVCVVVDPTVVPPAPSHTTAAYAPPPLPLFAGFPQLDSSFAAADDVPMAEAPEESEGFVLLDTGVAAPLESAENDMMLAGENFAADAEHIRSNIPESFNNYYHAKFSVQQCGGSLIDELLMQDPRTISALRSTAVAANGISAGAVKRRKTTPVIGLDENQQQSCHPLTHLFRFPLRFQEKIGETAVFDARGDIDCNQQSVDVDVVEDDSARVLDYSELYQSPVNQALPFLNFENVDTLLNFAPSSAYNIVNNETQSQQTALYEEMYKMRNRSPFKRHGVSTCLKNRTKKSLQRRVALSVLCMQIFDDEHRRRITYCAAGDVTVEPIRRYNSIVMTTNRWLMFMSQHVQWDEMHALWLHAWILDYFLDEYFRIYIDVLHRARQHCPLIIENLCNFLPPAMSPLERSVARSTLIERWLNIPPWDPVMQLLSANKPPPLICARRPLTNYDADSDVAESDYNIKILLIPPAPDNEHQAQPPRRISNLMEHLSGFAEVERIAFPPAWFPSTQSVSNTAAAMIDPCECWRLCQELCMERADAMLNISDEDGSVDDEDDDATANYGNKRRRNAAKRQLLVLWGWELGSITALMVAKRIYQTLKQNYTRVIASAVAANAAAATFGGSLLNSHGSPVKQSIEQLRCNVYNAFPRICVVCFGFPLKYVEMFAGQHALCDMLKFDSETDRNEGELSLNNLARPSLVFLTGSESRKCNWRELEAHRLNMYTAWSSSLTSAVAAAPPAVSPSTTTAPPQLVSTATQSSSSVCADSWHFVLEHCSDNLLMRMPALNEFCLTQTLVDRCVVDQVRECLAHLVRRVPLKLVIRRAGAVMATLPRDVNTLSYMQKNLPCQEKKRKPRAPRLSLAEDCSSSQFNISNNNNNVSATSTDSPMGVVKLDAAAEAKKLARKLARQTKRRQKAEADKLEAAQNIRFNPNVVTATDTSTLYG